MADSMNEQLALASAPGTRLIELTGNASDPSIDPHDDLPEYLEVSSNNTVTIRVPRNQNANGDWHGSGYVIYVDLQHLNLIGTHWR